MHNDSTTVSFCGAYTSAAMEQRFLGRPTLAITFGHNKDHRPDLKQLLFILTVTADGGVPLHFRAESGNVVDDQTHRDTWDLLCQLTGRRDFLYVADCKLASSENMAYLHQRQGRFVATPSYVPVAVGTVVFVTDKGDYGDVVSDLGDSCDVHFRNPDTGCEYTVPLSKSLLRAQDGTPLSGNAEPDASVVTTLAYYAVFDAADMSADLWAKWGDEASKNPPAYNNPYNSCPADAAGVAAAIDGNYNGNETSSN